MKIAIKFHDNDFGSCFYGVLETIMNARKWNDNVTEDKEQLCKIINEISYGIYLLYQNSFEYNDEKRYGIDKIPDGEPTFTTSQETDIWEMIADGMELEEILSTIRKW